MQSHIWLGSCLRLQPNSFGLQFTATANKSTDWQANGTTQTKDWSPILIHLYGSHSDIANSTFYHGILVGEMITLMQLSMAAFPFLIVDTEFGFGVENICFGSGCFLANNKSNFFHSKERKLTFQSNAKHFMCEKRQVNRRYTHTFNVKGLLHKERRRKGKREKINNWDKVRQKWDVLHEVTEGIWQKSRTFTLKIDPNS